ncbi:MAG TPA: thiamine pyrophosphate-dependent enzyme, partial [Pirellulales bacterium]
MATARKIDRVELDLVRRGLAFFHVAGAGHEATACLARHLTPDDWLHVHYRDKALLLARGLPIEEFFASLLCRAGSHSEGRQMSAHLSAPHLNVLSQTGPVGNHALQAVGVAAALTTLPLPLGPQAGAPGQGEGGMRQREDGLPSPSSTMRDQRDGLGRPSSHDTGAPIVVCSTGDGSTQQGQFLEAIAEAVRWRLPVLFLIEDNHLAISTRTRGKTFFDLPRDFAPRAYSSPLAPREGNHHATQRVPGDAYYDERPAEEFYGLPIVRVDGGDVPAVDRVFEEVVARMRTDPAPAIVVLDVERLTDHSNADDQSQYRDHDEVRKAQAADPLRRLEDVLVEHGVCPGDLREIRADVTAQVEAAAARALALPEPIAYQTAKLPLPQGPQAGAPGWGEGGMTEVTSGGPTDHRSPLAPREGNHHAERGVYGTLAVPGAVAAEAHHECTVGNAHTALRDGLGRPSSSAAERAEYTGINRQPLTTDHGPAATLTMREALNAVLRHHLATDDRVFLYGQDIEDPKGDVFGVTRGLSSQFPGRVVNSPLAEATIIGTCIGRALAGQRPVAFIQFADFLPLAYNQIATELASMYWRTGGDSSPHAPREGNHHAERDAYYGWQCPVIVMITCGGYKPGLGPFHSHTLESIAAHTPGIDVVMPSTAGDAAGLLNAAFESGRPTLFFYPKSCLNLAERGTSADVERQYVPLGRAKRVPIQAESVAVAGAPSTGHRSPLAPREGNHHAERGVYGSRPHPNPLPEGEGTNPALTLVTWGNTIDQCQRAANALAAAGIATDLLDLRSLSPWDEQAVIASAERTGQLIIVHEDNHTCGFGAEVAATVAEKAAVYVKIRRVTRPDTFVPCNFGNQLEILPSFQRVLETCAELLELDVQWQPDIDDDPTIGVIRATGSGPADDRVEIVEMRVALGDRIATGQVVAIVEAAKSVVDVVSDISGTAIEILAAPGDRVAVGQPLMRLSLEDGLPSPSRKSQEAPCIHENPGVPILRRVGIAHHEPTVGNTHHKSMVGNAHPTFAADCGSVSVGRLAKPSEASDGLAGRPTDRNSPKRNETQAVVSITVVAWVIRLVA